MFLWDGMSQFLWEKWTLNMCGWNVAMGQNVTQLGWPKMFGRNVQLWHFAPKKCSKRNVQGWTNNPSTLRPNVTVDAVNTGHCVGWTFRGCQNVTRTFQAWTFRQGTVPDSVDMVSLASDPLLISSLREFTVVEIGRRTAGRRAARAEGSVWDDVGGNVRWLEANMR
jgi:hypothetical protein